MKKGGQKYREIHSERAGGGGGKGVGAVFRQRIIHREVLQKKPEEKVFYTGLGDRVNVLHRTDRVNVLHRTG